jgi:hypothetical protein
LYKKCYINTIRKIYKDQSIVIKLGKYISQPLHVNKGLRQKCSSMLIIIFLEENLKGWKNKFQQMGIKIDKE